MLLLIYSDYGINIFKLLGNCGVISWDATVIIVKKICVHDKEYYFYEMVAKELDKDEKTNSPCVDEPKDKKKNNKPIRLFPLLQ